MSFIKSSVTNLAQQLVRLSILTNKYASTVGAARNASFWSTFSSKQELFNEQQGTRLLALGGVRYKYTKRPNYKVAKKLYKDDKDAIHCHGFSFYPRFPNHKDPPIEPTKLFMVKRIRSLYGCPRWEKKLMYRLKLVHVSDVAIMKNSEANNKLLYQVKHLVEIQPITAPYGLPDKPENGFLKENGEFVSYNPLTLHGEDVTFDDARSQLVEYHEKNIGGLTLRHRLHQRWYSRFDII